MNRRSGIGKVSVDASDYTRSTRKGTRILPPKAKFKKSVSPRQKYTRITKEKISVIGKGGPRQSAN